MTFATRLVEEDKIFAMEKRGDGRVSYDVQPTTSGLAAVERFDGPTAQFTIGPPATLVLERLAGTPGDATHRLG